eukprot:scaffold7544_cov107-Isochrysis_galbana.AAC.4
MHMYNPGVLGRCRSSEPPRLGVVGAPPAWRQLACGESVRPPHGGGTGRTGEGLDLPHWRRRVRWAPGRRRRCEGEPAAAEKKGEDARAFPPARR